MHEIPPHLEQMLRAQGLTDAQIDELRRTGHLDGDDGAGNTFAVDVESTSDPSVTLNGQTFESGHLELPPEAARMLQRFHRLVPREALESIEAATGTDIDGDGYVGKRPATASADAANRHDTAPASNRGASGAVPGGSTSGDPFVSATPARSVGVWLLALILIAGAVAIWLLLR